MSDPRTGQCLPISAGSVPRTNVYGFFAEYLLQPVTILWLLMGLALLGFWYKRRETRKRLLRITLPYVLLTMFCVPTVGDLVVGSLEHQYRPLDQKPADVQAIVVLAGYVATRQEPGQLAEMNESTFD